MGKSSKIKILVTNKGVIELTSNKIFWFIDKGVTVISFTPSSVNYVGYSMVKKWLVFNTRHFLISTTGGNTAVEFKGSKEELFEFTEKVRAVIG